MKVENAPYFPPVYDMADAAAIKALAAGTATEDQQRRALKWMVEKACCTYDVSYRPSGDRDTAFAEGRRFVGIQIVKMVNLDMSIFKKEAKS